MGDVAVDHKEPCGSLKSVADIEPFVRRLIVGPEGLQVLCKANCHAAKTLAERKARTSNGV